MGDPTRRFAVALVVGESCLTCHRLLPRYLELARGYSGHDASFCLAALTDGTGLHGLADGLVVVPHARRWSEPMGIRVTPYLLVVDRARNQVWGRVVGSIEALDEALTSALALEEISG